MSDTPERDIEELAVELVIHNKRFAGRIPGSKALVERATKLFPGIVKSYQIGHSDFHPWTSEVIICSLEGSGYETAAEEQTPVVVFAGGPSAAVAAALHASTGRFDGSDGAHGVVFVSDGFAQSSARGSALYMHIRHSNALNADPLLQGHCVLRRAIQRLWHTPTPEDARELEFVKVDLMPRDVFGNWRSGLVLAAISLSNEVHGLTNAFLSCIGKGQLSDWAQNRALSHNTPVVLGFLDRVCDTAEFGPLVINGEVEEDELPIHLTFSAADAAEQVVENQHLWRDSGIQSERLDAADLQRVGLDVERMNSAGCDVAGWVYPHDGRVSPRWQEKLLHIVRQFGQRVLDQHRITRIFLDDERVAGVEVRNSATGELAFVRAHAAVLSLGWRTTYRFDSSLGSMRLPFSGPVEDNCIATGFSGFALVRGRIPIVGTRNSHWTELAYDKTEDISLVKCTGGGTINSEEIPATYILNNIQHLRTMFGDRYLGMVEAGTCSRAVNGQNDACVTSLWPNLLISTGQGGTGITKMGALGLAYLHLLGVAPQIPDADLKLPRDLLTIRSVRTAANLGLSMHTALANLQTMRHRERSLRFKADASAVAWRSKIDIAERPPEKTARAAVAGSSFSLQHDWRATATAAAASASLLLAGGLLLSRRRGWQRWPRVPSR